MSSTKEKYQPMDSAKYDKEVMDLFLPTDKITRTPVGYKMIAQYNNLSYHIFKQTEIDFLCDCYHSGIYSLIGVTNVHGERRLTITGIRDRYRIDVEVIRKWLVTYKRKLKLLKESIIFGDAHGNDQTCIII